MATEEPKPAPASDRRRAPRALDETEEPQRRRLRDRLSRDESVALSPVLGRQPALRNPLLLCDDDLRETARALERIEAFLLQAVRTLERRDLCAADLDTLLRQDVEGHLDALSRSLQSLRRSLATIAE
ncbi:MAG: hypothetical protein RMK29_18690, partial [Myxococcales bacterium]|nr:hypothetical protein [Myxococcales bacterium]